jgi:hypothetical protein
MNLYVVDATMNGNSMQPGTEVGIFDGNICVGSAVITTPLQSESSYLSIIAGMDDPTTDEIDGYIPGSPVHVRVYDGKSYHNAYSGDLVFEERGTGVMQLSVNSIPSSYKLYDSYPNPFNPVTTIQYELPKAGMVSLIVYNILGDAVYTLTSDYKEPGSYQVNWDAKNHNNKPVSSGIYFIVMKAEGFTQTNRVMLLK